MSSELLSVHEYDMSFSNLKCADGRGYRVAQNLGSGDAVYLDLQA
jgi:hypothetical protein